MKLADGRRMNVSEWAGGYTREFAKCLLKGAEAFLKKHYTCGVETFAVRKPKFGPEEEHYASSAESEHEDQDMQQCSLASQNK
jgi:hypothetical protein